MSAWCDDGYRTDLPLEDVTGGQAWIADQIVAALQRGYQLDDALRPDPQTRAAREARPMAVDPPALRQPA